MLIHNKHQQPITSSNSPVMLLSGEYLWAVLGSQTCKTPVACSMSPAVETPKTTCPLACHIWKEMSCFKAF